MSVLTTASLLSATFGASLALTINVVSPAHAATVDSNADTIMRVVHTDGLDLSVPADQFRLRHRIVLAAYHVCSDLMQGESTLDDRFTACVRDAKRDALRQAEAKIAAAQSHTVVATAKP